MNRLPVILWTNRSSHYRRTNNVGSSMCGLVPPRDVIRTEETWMPPTCKACINQARRRPEGVHLGTALGEVDLETHELEEFGHRDDEAPTQSQGGDLAAGGRRVGGVTTDAEQTSSLGHGDRQPATDVIEVHPTDRPTGGAA